MGRKMPKYTTDEDLELLADLGIEVEPDPISQRSAQEERIIAGFEEIERFVEEQGRLPEHGEEHDIFERLYAVRLDRLRKSEECRAVLEPLDSRGLLAANVDTSLSPEADLDDETLLSSLGIEAASENDVTQLTHVRSRQEIKAAEEIAQRTPCQDFDNFKPIFEQVQDDLKNGARETVKYQDNAQIHTGDLFILNGQKALVAFMGEVFTTESGLENCRLRVIYDNGTEGDYLLRSLQRALNKDKTSRRITQLNTNLGPLFTDIASESDLSTGYIYVLRSQSDDPFIAANRSVIHKIGVTTGDVKKRIANAVKDPTYLLADVEIVATFKLANINPQKLEVILHKFFHPGRLNVQLQDRFGIPVNPREWFLVPLPTIEEAIKRIKEGTINQFRYDPKTASLMGCSRGDAARSRSFVIDES
jgi:hypothetical protein